MVFAEATRLHCDDGVLRSLTHAAVAEQLHGYAFTTSKVHSGSFLAHTNLPGKERGHCIAFFSSTATAAVYAGKQKMGKEVGHPYSFQTSSATRSFQLSYEHCGMKLFLFRAA